MSLPWQMSISPHTQTHPPCGNCQSVWFHHWKKVSSNNNLPYSSFTMLASISLCEVFTYLFWPQFAVFSFTEAVTLSEKVLWLSGNSAHHWCWRVENTALVQDFSTLSIHLPVNGYLTLFGAEVGDGGEAGGVEPHLSYTFSDTIVGSLTASSRWALMALGTTSHINCQGVRSVPFTQFPTSLRGVVDRL